MASKDELGDRMKSYEAVETHRKLDLNLPIYARIDGRGFSKFTQHMHRPFDQRMTDCMIETTKHLIDATHAEIGYVQSDEISLVWQAPEFENSGFFSGKVQKLCSVLAGIATARFAVAYYDLFGTLSRDYPHFDCRVISMPSETEAANMMLWRELDARKNAVSMAARHFFSHSALQHKSGAEMAAMMLNHGQSMNDYPVAFTRGTWLQRVVEQRTLTKEELQRIPVDRQPEDGTTFSRSSIKVIQMPPFADVANRVEVIFDHAAPINEKVL